MRMQIKVKEKTLSTGSSICENDNGLHIETLTVTILLGVLLMNRLTNVTDILLQDFFKVC